MRRYITTAIDYPNAPPHIGHVLEKVLADVLARWWRLQGDDVRFQIGLDEHGVKIQRAALQEGQTPQNFVDRMFPLFRDPYDRLQVSYDDFIRTSDRVRHWPTVVELWKRLAAEGMLEKRKYRGLYCVGCEKFLLTKDCIDGKCPTHRKAPEEVQEENWFFLLSRETQWLKDLLTREHGGYRIVPSFRAQETLSFLEQGLEDVSFSRPMSSLSWGVPVPGDEGQVMYVWCDALTNYVSTLNVFQDQEQKKWWEDAEVTHVIGKDIARFHALIWPAMLKHARLRIPDRLLIHGFMTHEGQKMSKSLGNVVYPDEVVVKYGVDALRFFLMHEIPVGNDGDFSWKRFAQLYDSKLRNTIGNLLNRVLVLLKKDGGMLGEFEKDVGPWGGYTKAMENFELSKALQHVTVLAEAGNKLIDDVKPWTLPPDTRIDVLTTLADHLRHMSLMLLPFVPLTAQKMAVQLGLPYVEHMLNRDFIVTEEMKRGGGEAGWKSVGEPEILFPPVE